MNFQAISQGLEALLQFSKVVYYIAPRPQLKPAPCAYETV